MCTCEIRDMENRLPNHSWLLTGAGVAASMGLPDVGLASLDNFCRVIR